MPAAGFRAADSQAQAAGRQPALWPTPRSPMWILGFPPGPPSLVTDAQRPWERGAQAAHQQGPGRGVPERQLWPLDLLRLTGGFLLAEKIVPP